MVNTDTQPLNSSTEFVIYTKQKPNIANAIWIPFFVTDGWW
jgi:hypothetical protein